MGEEHEKAIAAKSSNWESDRIALSDMILMKMALTEVRIFEQIPVKVTMNEYIEDRQGIQHPEEQELHQRCAGQDLHRDAGRRPDPEGGPWTTGKLNMKKGLDRTLNAGVYLGHLLLLFAIALGLPSCRITDHSEREPEVVSSDTLDFPASGYENVDPKDLPKMDFEVTHLDLGQIVQGTQVDSVYTFTNTGGGPLVITDVRGSCGCTVGKDWPKHPVKPNERATISISFDSEGRSGRQDKTVTVVANTSATQHRAHPFRRSDGPTTAP